MQAYIKLSAYLNLLFEATLFFKKHFLAIISLGLIAAFGRVIQLGGFGEISAALNILLEIIIESARILIFLYVLGLTNIKKGIGQIKNLFTEKIKRKQYLLGAITKFKENWSSIIINFVGFLVLASLLNFLIDQLAYQTCLLLSLKKGGVLAPKSSEWTILLFFKNLSVIPFMLIFQTIFLLWLTGKLQPLQQNKIA